MRFPGAESCKIDDRVRYFGFFISAQSFCNIIVKVSEDTGLGWIEGTKRVFEKSTHHHRFLR